MNTFSEIKLKPYLGALAIGLSAAAPTWADNAPAHEDATPKAMDHSMHAGMAMPAIDAASGVPAVSDGAAPFNIPMPYPDAMHMVDDPLVGKLTVDQLEIRDTDSTDKPWILEAQGWIGKDINKLHLKADIEQVGDEVHEARFDLLYGRAVSPYWDALVGVRADIKPEKENWLAIGVTGLAPFFIETDAMLFAASDGQTELNVAAEYEIMLTQKLVLSPEAALTFYGKNDEENNRGSGLSRLNAGLRLRYEIQRELAPYIGVEWSKQYGNTADFSEANGASIESSSLVAGLRFWF